MQRILLKQNDLQQFGGIAAALYLKEIYNYDSVDLVFDRDVNIEDYNAARAYCLEWIKASPIVFNSVTLPCDGDNIPEFQFVGQQFGRTVIIPDGVKSIGEGAFQFADCKRLVLPATLEKIAPDVFFKANIEEIEIPCENLFFEVKENRLIEKSNGNVVFDSSKKDNEIKDLEAKVFLLEKQIKMRDNTIESAVRAFNAFCSDKGLDCKARNVLYKELAPYQFVKTRNGNYFMQNGMALPVCENNGIYFTLPPIYYDYEVCFQDCTWHIERPNIVEGLSKVRKYLEKFI